MIEKLPLEAIWDIVRRSTSHPCRYGVSGPCMHPNCLQDEFDRLSKTPGPHPAPLRAQAGAK